MIKQAINILTIDNSSRGMSWIKGTKWCKVWNSHGEITIIPYELYPELDEICQKIRDLSHKADNIFENDK